MDGWPFLLIDALLLIVAWGILMPVARESDDRRQGDDDDQAGHSQLRCAAVQPVPHGTGPAWHGRTLPAHPPGAPPRRPRVSAGRVTAANRIRYQYALADQPACQVLASYGWPAQEVQP